MITYWKICEVVAMQIATAIALLFVLAVLMGAANAHPNKSCHQHGTVTHCK